MPTNAEVSVIEKIKRTHKNIAAVIGAIAVFILIICTFTIGSLVDSDHASFIWIQCAVALLMVLILFILKRVAFFLTRIWLGGRKQYRDALGSLSIADIGKE